MESLNNVYKSIQWINSLFENKERPKYLLDPLTTIIKLAMLKYKTPLTKICIFNNEISFSDPSPFQGINRWRQGASRINIHYLYLPILYFCYLKYACQSTQQVQPDLPDSDLTIPDVFKNVVEQFNQLAIDGLLELKRTYVDSQNDLVINCLDLYLLMLTSEDENSIKQRYEKVNITTKNTYVEFMKCWRESFINLIKQMFDLLQIEPASVVFNGQILKSIDDCLVGINHFINQLREP